MSRLAHDEATHRFANLLQLTICTLERAARTTSGGPQQALSTAIEQVRATSRLHGLLDLADSGDALARPYLCMLCDTLDTLALTAAGHTMSAHIDIEHDLVLPSADLRCLGQLVAEAVVNAAKHGYSGGKTGHVAVTLSRAGPRLCCTIADDGIGSFGALSRPGSRGVTLMDGLARQMGGGCGWVFGDHGTTVRVTWPVRAVANAQTSQPS